jgi:hypothetical protein
MKIMKIWSIKLLILQHDDKVVVLLLDHINTLHFS